MKITQDHLDFVAQCIANGEDAGEDAVRVDVLAIGERFSLPWPAARDLLQAAAKRLGHRMIGARSSKVSKSSRPVCATPAMRTPLQSALAAVEALMSEYDQESHQSGLK